MPVKSIRQVLAILFLCSTLVLRSAGQQPLTPQQLADEANTLSDLSKLESYRLKAIVAIGNDKRGATGTLTLDHDQENTRQELEFTDYHEVNLTRGNLGYFYHKPAISLYVAERVRRFDELLWVGIPLGSEVGTVRLAKVNGVQALCFIMSPEKYTHIRNCFDATTHLLLSRTTTAEGGLETVFLDYHEIDGVHVPGTIRFIEPEQAAMEVHDIAAMKMSFEPAHFAPLSGVRSFPTCRHLEPPIPVKRVNPEYPQIAKLKHLQGDAHLLVTVGENGKVVKVAALSGHPAFVEAASDALKQWEYKAATCPSGPTEDEVIVVVQFHIR